MEGMFFLAIPAGAAPENAKGIPRQPRRLEWSGS
jgi:hypothetical protein